MAGKFLYFAYGSNMLQQRIHINNKSAHFKHIAKLPDYELSFGHFSSKWHGCVASVEAFTSSNIWGVVWELDISDLPNLDRQEGVPNKIYRPFTVSVYNPEGLQMDCRTYQLIEKERCKPSLQYKSVIVEGARQHNLPDYYIKYLESIPDNGYDGVME